MYPYEQKLSQKKEGPIFFLEIWSFKFTFDPDQI